MKAKKIKKIRLKMKPYLVQRSYAVCGCFYSIKSMKDVVLARSEKEAVKRYCKRTHATGDLNAFDKVPYTICKMFAVWMVVPFEKSFERFVTYWK
jgi:hypothetical protein